MNSIDFHLIEGEVITGMRKQDNKLFIFTSLNRMFESTDSPVECIDFIEVSESKGGE